MKEEEEPQHLDIGKQNINNLSSDVLENKAGDTSCSSSKNISHTFKDSMLDISSLNTSVSGLTSSVNLHNSDEMMHATTAAKIIVQSLELLTSSE